MNLFERLAALLKPTGLAQGAVDTVSARPQYEKLAMDAAVRGEDFPRFEEWVQTQGKRLPTLPAPARN
jgi:hypothetical protein